MSPFRRSAAFTLLELMIVLMIIGILMSAFVFSAGKIFGDTQVKETANRLRVLASAVEEYRQIEAAIPNDRLPPGAAGNSQNASAEALVLALYAPSYTGTRPGQEWLVNTDADSSRKSLTIFPNRELFEYGDFWGNPIVYFDGLHYSEVQVVLAGAEGDLHEQEVHARRDPRTGGWVAPGRFQLLSAGPDGEFGTDDDLADSDR